MYASVEAEHVVEAETPRTPLHFQDRDAAWEACYGALKAAAERRIVQELDRVGGSCARVVDEDVHSKASDSTGEYWLAGRFTYVQYDDPRAEEDRERTISRPSSSAATIAS